MVAPPERTVTFARVPLPLPTRLPALDALSTPLSKLSVLAAAVVPYLAVVRPPAPIVSVPPLLRFTAAFVSAIVSLACPSRMLVAVREAFCPIVRMPET